MLEELGIPVFVDRSSYEPHPLGRAEWIRVYAAMLGRDAEADSFFRKQEALAEEVGHRDNSGKTVAVFSVNTNGSIVIRKRDDYIPNMLRMAGGKYEQICDTITNTLGTISGMVCDGAKPSCASKIASAVDTAILAYEMSMAKKHFQSGDGLIKNNIEATIRSVGRMAAEGMVTTDQKILELMLEKDDPENEK